MIQLPFGNSYITSQVYKSAVYGGRWLDKLLEIWEFTDKLIIDQGEID